MRFRMVANQSAPEPRFVIKPLMAEKSKLFEIYRKMYDSVNRIQ